VSPVSLSLMVLAYPLQTPTALDRPCNFFRACWGPVESGLIVA
jgi:hypothetical protein